jgi:hypothetical protein
MAKSSLFQSTMSWPDPRLNATRATTEGTDAVDVDRANAGEAPPTTTPRPIKTAIVLAMFFMRFVSSREHPCVDVFCSTGR